MTVRVDDFIDPASEAAHPGIQRRGGRVRAAIASGDNPSDDPSARLLLAQQPASRVALATIPVNEAGVWGAAGAQRAMTGEAVTEALLTLPRRHQRDPGSKDRV